jgi:Gpi18-like mannosyltransferase
MKKHYLIISILLVLGFLARTYKLDSPIADWHSWRQADTSAVTRNYVKYGINLLFPRYDDFSDVSGKGLFNPQGYRFVEFPIFNLLHFGLFQITKSLLTIESAGRLTSALASTVSALTLYFIVKRKSNFSTALLSMFYFLFIPYNIFFSRVVLPDPLMVTLFLLCLNFYDQRKHSFTILFGSLAILVKPVAVFFLLPIFLSNLWMGLSMLLPFGLWRYWSYQFPQGVPASGWLLNGNGIRFKPSFFQWLFGTRLSQLILGKWGLWPLLSGLFNQTLPT